MCAAFFFPRGLRVSSGGGTWSPVDKASSNEYDRLHCGKGHFFVVFACVRFGFPTSGIARSQTGSSDRSGFRVTFRVEMFAENLNLRKCTKRDT